MKKGGPNGGRPFCFGDWGAIRCWVYDGGNLAVQMSGGGNWFSEAQLQARRPVWNALSWMYLDTEVSEDRDWRIRVLSASPYSIDELDTIHRDEVRPVCLPNLFDVAGVWEGFNADWLEQAIRNHKRGGENWPASLMARVHRSKAAFKEEPEWMATRQGIIALRAQASEPA
ncbi:hypothetical protein FBZ91_109102 [Nitrospirillum viridazoti]|uniref:DUF7079 family protein n=2 Tax=Nitrospirillum viridazoti TaxID=3144925 RepID=UPI00119CFBB1|nr:hypothetical protein [Nitrospirillum amazonense]TWB36243.1 hypothetical protein FBZ91_109102 [Nitrospirillum amazonense]